MFSCKLLALGYPDASAKFSDDLVFRDLIAWLEVNHIQGHTEEGRATLKNIQSANWNSSFAEYLERLSSPYNAASDRNSLISWFLSRAVRQAYTAKANELKDLTAEKWEEANSTENPLNSLNYDDPTFVNLAQSLSQILSLPPHQNHKELLVAACMLITDRMKANAYANSNGAAKRTKTDPLSAAEASIPLSSTPLGFDSGDYILNDVAKVLRLQHINELRELQTLVDEAIVTVQKITANPKTDTKLGKQGF